jgi:3-dehydroquinate synthase
MTQMKDTPPDQPRTHDVGVSLGQRSYTIGIACGNLRKLSETIREKVVDRSVVVVTDSNVGPLYLNHVCQQLTGIATSVQTLTVDAGESSKSVAVCDSLWQQMDDFGTDRSTVVVALGGGVVGDLAGFLAATYARGLDFIQIPTSLLAQVDSSVGGKVGINLPQSKNMVGAFWQPQSVVIDPEVLDTLDEANFVAGMAEVIKYGLIMDAELFAFIEKNIVAIKQRDYGVMAKLIAWCCRCKAQIVQEDERESSGRRAILNYGHTYGHAIESVFGYGEYLHGQAIAIGMVCAARLAKQLAMVDQAFCDTQRQLFEALGLPVDCPQQRHDELIDAMMRDKKVVGGTLKMILPKSIGEVVVQTAPADSEIFKSLINEKLNQRKA